MDDRSTLHSCKPWLPLLVTLALMAGLGGWVGWQWYVLEKQNRVEQVQRFSLAVSDLEDKLRERMRAYEMVLRGLAGLVAGSQQISLDDWSKATDQLQLQDFYPGIQALVLARHVSRDDLPALVESIHADDRADFTVFPPGERDEYLVADFIHPLDWRNRRVVGFDLFSEQVRRDAIVAARDSGNPTLTGPIRLKQETDQNGQVGVLLFLPMYKVGAPITTIEERRAAFVGTVHGAFRLTDLVEGILASRSPLFQLQLFDAAEPNQPLLVGRAPVSRDAEFHNNRSMYMYGRSWQLDVASTPVYETILANPGRTFSLAAAMAAALLFALLVGGYLYARERALRNSQVLGLKLQEREARFRQLIEQLPVATLLCNPQGRIELANQSAATLLGSTAGLLAGERLSRYVPGALDKALGEINYQESQASREDGTPVPVSISVTGFRRDGGIYHILNLVDLQPRKRDEERFRNVVEASPNAFLLFDSEGRIVMVNRQTELLFGYPRQELLGQQAELLIPESMRRAYLEVRHRFMLRPEPRRLGENRELFGRHKDGHLLPVEVGLSPLRSGNELLVQAVVIDISHRKAAERRLREQADQLMVANRYKSEFLANMSHELRTPLNSILILSDQLKLNAAGNLTEKQVRHAEIIYRAGHDLLQLINDVLDLARIEAGHMQLKLEPLDLRELLAELESGLAPMAEQKGLALRVEVEPDVPVQLVSDRVRLLQILRNLLTNALKFTEQGKVEVRVSRRSAPQADDVLLIQVCDTGIGIAEAEQERIFQAFEQIDGSISRQYGGTGLGLAIARQLVEVLGGGISVKSAPGKGACFTVELPIQLASTGATEQLAVTRHRGRGPGLLIVDSDADFASVVAECGQNHGFSSVVCETGQQGMLALEHERFAAVIMEILLPDISGWQLHRALRTDGRHQDVPVYIITSVPKPQDWHDGDSHYLLKPVSQAELERLFVDLAQRERNPMRLLLMETDPERRHRLHRYLEQLGYRVTDCRRSEEARLAFAERPFSALVIDFDLPNEDGLDLLEALGRLRPLQDVSIIVNSEDPLSEHNLQRLRRYSGVALSKHEGLEHMKEALKPATTQVGAIAMNDAQHPSLGQRVLLVDADVRSIYILSALLDEQGLQVVAATTSSEALERFDEDAFDLALIDTKLPNDDGPALIRQLRNDYGCQVPVVALCSVLEEAERERCIEAGANDYLVKPTDQASLARLLQRWLNRDGGSLQS